MKIASILAVLLGLSCHAETIEGSIVGVTDGDTITVSCDLIDQTEKGQSNEETDIAGTGVGCGE